MNKNRNSSLEIPCSLPIAYALKDYKLTSNLTRKATDEVLNECKRNGLKILSFATDGQWIKLMSRDSQNTPLTIFQHQRDTWNSTK
jgi:4-aminobutyrate aminotransferase-like enzyme